MAGACARCGSGKLIPDVPLLDHYGAVGEFSDQATVEVQAKPNAWFSKKGVSSKLSALICGECGFVELRVSNPQQLYEAYQRSLQG